MKASPLLVAWHNDKTPIYSVQFEPRGRGRLATAGGDNNIRLWSIEAAGDERKVTYLATLSKHSQAVNVVRWSPRDEHIASAGDDGTVIVWAQSDIHQPNKFGEEALDDKETWMARRQCRSNTSHEYGIYDLAWSPDGAFFVTGSTDNVARIYDALTGNVVRQIAEHNHYVQGVAWDPLNEYLATQSSDRSVHIYKLHNSDGLSALGQPALYSRMARMDIPGRRPSSNSPAPPDFGHRALLSAAVASGGLAASPESHSIHPPPHLHPSAASPAPSAPGTPTSTPLPMDPPPPSTHSRKHSNSIGSRSPAVHRSPSPAPSMPLPAIMQASPNPFGGGGGGGGAGGGYKNANIYANEAFTSFFRRLTFAPDGSLLFTPAGQYKAARPAPGEGGRAVDEVINTVYIYSRGGLNRPPVAHLPGHKKPSVAVRCSSVLYELRLPSAATRHITIDTSSAGGGDMTPLPDPVMGSKPRSDSTASTATTSMDPPPFTGVPAAAAAPAAPSTPDSTARAVPADLKTPPDGPQPVFQLPYRVVYAVATQDAVFVYDTQQQTPLCVVSNLHFATFTDLTWSSDGLTLLMSSSDGFCSALSFAPGELGSIYHGAVRARQLKPAPAAISVGGASTPTPHPTPPIVPSVARRPSAASLAPAASPVAAVRPASPTRSNSASSIATQSSFAPHAGGIIVSNPTPSVSNLPGVAATGSKAFVVPPLASPTPPMTPLPHAAAAGGGSAGSSFASAAAAHLKREGESSRPSEEGPEPKKRRVAPTPVDRPGLATAAAPGAREQPAQPITETEGEKADSKAVE